GETASEPLEVAAEAAGLTPVAGSDREPPQTGIRAAGGPLAGGREARDGTGGTAAARRRMGAAPGRAPGRPCRSPPVPVERDHAQWQPGDGGSDNHAGAILAVACILAKIRRWAWVPNWVWAHAGWRSQRWDSSSWVMPWGTCCSSWGPTHRQAGRFCLAWCRGRPSRALPVSPPASWPTPGR